MTKLPFRHLIRFFLPTLVVFTCASYARAQGLSEMVEWAQHYDATLQSAQGQVDAARAKSAQARAGVLPVVGFSAGVVQTNQAVASVQGAPAFAYNYAQQYVGVNASQPLYRPANRIALVQGDMQNALAQEQLRAAEQDLIVRVGQAYFDVLAAADTVRFTAIQKDAVTQQLASSQRNFDAGNATIVDARDAQARFDWVDAQGLAARNDLAIKQFALQQWVGESNLSPRPLAEDGNLTGLVSGDLAEWLARALDQNPLLGQLSQVLEMARMETRKAQAAGKPSLDLVASYSASNASNGTALQPANYDARANTASIGLTFNYPLFAGYSIQNRVRETLALEDKAAADLAAEKRVVAQTVRATYLSLQSGLLQMKALDASQRSAQSALEANQLGYSVGAKVNMDVLNAQSQLFSAQVQWARARYDVVLGAMQLRRICGTLSKDDVVAINALLAPDETAH